MGVYRISSPKSQQRPLKILKLLVVRARKRPLKVGLLLKVLKLLASPKRNPLKRRVLIKNKIVDNLEFIKSIVY